ncbi:MAG TPA: alpha-amylase family glycosyl hydrolase [Patescibacteria group bacterium]|nr:alpha-amylase family glycosyl hydrolase [Patescibacteria group bacterium]
MVLYNLFPLLAGPFSKWGPHLKRAADMGFDWVFCNPIQQLGASKSLYSIADYFSFNPVLLDPNAALAPDEQFRQMRQEARQAGLKLMIDLVINHCAIDSHLTKEKPEWFVREADGSVAKAFCMHNQQKVVWDDLAQFDHNHTTDPEGLYQYCLRVVEHLLGLGFEGFRCDAAYKIPRKFWKRLIYDTRRKAPEACFTAETLGCTADQTKETARAGFDYVFNSSKYWNFHDTWLLSQYNLVRESTSSISFPESHDTGRLMAECHGNLEGLKQRYLFSALFSAGVMMPIGFEYGFSKPLHVVKTTPADWETTNFNLCDYVAKVNSIKKSHPIFLEESSTQMLHSPNPNILLLWKGSVKRPHEALLILNKDICHHQEFYTDTFRHYVQSGSPLKDVSPEYPLDFIPEPFHYGLRPGQGIVLVTTRA